MTKDEVIKILNDYDINFERNTPEEVAEAHEMAIEALQEHQYYKDLAESYEKTINKLTKAIAEQQSKTGHWVEHKHGEIEHIECSECGIWFLKADLPRKSYCPNCGSCNGDMIKNIMRDITKQ